MFILPAGPVGSSVASERMPFPCCWSRLPPWVWLLLPVLFLLSEVQGNCTAPEPPPYSSLQGAALKDSYPVGTVLTYSCIVGYEYIAGIKHSITCLNTSKWSEVSVFCQGKKCPRAVLENGKADPDGDIRLGGNITFSCVYGFRLIGEASVNCILRERQVVWNREFPFCQHIPCLPPDEIHNGSFVPNPKDEYYVGSMIIYRCNHDFSLIGNSTITCTVAEDGLNGKWNSLAPECKDVKCKPPEVENGQLVNLPKPSYTYDDGISFRCNHGYTAVGSLYIKCGADNSWVPAIPKCIKVTPTTTQPFPTSRVITKSITIHSEDMTTVTNEITQVLSTTSKDYTEVPNTTSKGYTGYNNTTTLGKWIILLAVVYSCW